MPYKKQKNFPASNWTRSQISQGFTLVELIVVVTILAILATIGFVSYSSYLTGVRDTNRLAQLVSISDGLELYSTKNNLPLPDDNVEVQANGTTIAYQGYAGANTLETIDFTKGGKDPRDDQYFTYYLTKDRKYFQLMGFLEESVDISTRNTQNNNTQNSLNIINSTHAVDYTDRIPSVYGKKLGILTDTTNTPIQEISTITTAGNIDVVTDDTTDYVAHMSDTSTMTGSTAGNSNMRYLQNTLNAGGVAKNCKNLIDKKNSLAGQDGIYIILNGGGDTIPVYCDMTTDGGGWTIFAKNGGTSETAGAKASGTENNGEINMSDSSRFSLDITSENVSGIMAKHFDTDDYVLYNDVNSSLFITELKDVAGETSANLDAQTDLGKTYIISDIGGVKFSGKTDITIFEIHRGGWNAVNTTNWIFASEVKSAGNTVTGMKNSFSNVGNRLVDNNTLSVNAVGNYGLLYR